MANYCEYHKSFFHGDMCPKCHSSYTPQDALQKRVFHYFFFGMADEVGLSACIAEAEHFGCEFVAIIPAMAQVQQSALALTSQNRPQMITVFRVFVRCDKDDYPRIEKLMQASQAERDKAAKAQRN